MKKSIVDFEVLETYIKQIEEIFTKNSLNQVEQDLILRQVHARLAKKMETQRANDLVNNNPLVKMAKKFLPGGGNEE